jgi:hypothetical protein
MPPGTTPFDGDLSLGSISQHGDSCLHDRERLLERVSRVSFLPESEQAARHDDPDVMRASTRSWSKKDSPPATSRMRMIGLLN